MDLDTAILVRGAGRRGGATQRRWLVCGMLLAVVLPSRAEAKLAPSSFKDLVEQSDLVAKAVVAEAKVDDKHFGSGYVILTIQEVYKGRWDGKPLKLEISSEVHDQKLSKVGEVRLYFLKRSETGWTGTHYGRSYWPLLPVKSKAGGLATPYLYPTTMVVFVGKDEDLLVPAAFAEEVVDYRGDLEGKMKQMIPLASIVQRLKQSVAKP